MNQQGCGGVSASGERGGGSERDYPAGRAAGAVSSVLPEGAEDAGDGVGVYEPVKDNTAYETITGLRKEGRKPDEIMWITGFSGATVSAYFPYTWLADHT